MVSAFPWKNARLYHPGMFFALFVLLAAPALTVLAEAQSPNYEPDSLFMALFSNGDSQVEYDVSIIDPLAEETRIALFGVTVDDLIVVDYEDKIVEYEIGARPNELVLRMPGVANVRISYATSDLVDKIDRTWIFSLDSPIGFSVKLPPDSVLIDWEGDESPNIVPVGDQFLMTFDPGSIQVSYVIGVLGTAEQANVVIKLAETTIAEISDRQPGIVLTGAKDQLQKAIASRDSGRFADAERLARQANDAAVAIENEYKDAQAAIADSDAQLKNAVEQGRDTIAARALLAQARTEFAAGSYAAARNSAEGSIAAIGDQVQEPALPLFVIVAAVVAGVGGAGAMLALRMRRPRHPAKPHEVAREPARAAEKAVAKEIEKPQKQAPPGPSQPEPQVPSTVPESSTDQTVLVPIVAKILQEKPQLRPEDQDVLRFLAEKEGAAFESEIRTRFNLPKTTIWRLVKRLEREELVEIRKAGGQNLIKLKFEGRQL